MEIDDLSKTLEEERKEYIKKKIDEYLKRGFPKNEAMMIKRLNLFYLSFYKQLTIFVF